MNTRAKPLAEHRIPKGNNYRAFRIEIISDFGLELPKEIENKIWSASSEVEADRIINDWLFANMPTVQPKSRYDETVGTTPCPFNDGVLCFSQDKCAKCGWNPRIAKVRTEELKRRIKYERCLK